MAVLIGLSGAQGAGKTSLLAELKSRGWAVDDFKVSRVVQEKLGYSSLAEATATARSIIEFQTEIFREKLARELVNLCNPDVDIILTERTFADIYVYTLHWLGLLVGDAEISLDQATGFMMEFYQDCTAAQKACYKTTLLLPLMEHIPREPDVRRADYDSADRVYTILEDFITTFWHQSEFFIITEKSIIDRADQIEIYLSKSIITGSSRVIQ